MPHSDAADILLAMKIAMAVTLAWAIGAAAVFHFVSALAGRATPLWRLPLVELALALLALFVLSRGAPHNNPALFALYADFGARGLAAAGALFAALAAAGGIAAFWLRARSPVASLSDWLAKPEALRSAVAALAALAMLAALEPVVRLWDVPGWGDSATYDRIAHQIAIGVMPAGHSYYMPVYQYGTAILYYAFGHFFFVQQVANVLFAPVTVILLCLSAWNLFRNPWAVLLVGAVAAADDLLRHAPHLQQIENWFNPAFALAIFAATKYFRAARWRNLLWLGLAAGLLVEIRAQALFFSAFLLLVPLFVRNIDFKERGRQFVLLAAVFAATLVPWTIRNVAVEGRLTPFGTQGAQKIVSTLSPEQLYGIRHDLKAPESPAANARPGTEAALAALAGRPLLILKAVPWRALAFYGLLPPGVWDPAGPRPTDWAGEGKEYLLRVFPVLCLLAAGVLGLMLRPGRATLFLTGGILANLAVVFFAGFSEPRLSYPVHALHILLAAAAVYSPRVEFAVAQGGAPPIAARRAFGLAAAAAALLLLAHVAVGRAYLLRPLMGAPAAYDSSASIEPSLPDLALLVPAQIRPGDGASLALRPGQRVRAVLALTNHQLPVKYYSFPMPEFPDFSADPKTPIYYRALLVDPAGGYNWRGSRQIGIDVTEAKFDRPLRENDVVEMEGEVLGVADSGLIWLRAGNVRLLHRGPDEGGTGTAHGF